MRSRRGFTLTELLVALVMLSVVLGALYRLLVNTQRVSRAQSEQVDMQSNMRAGTLIVPAELREIGFDTVYFGGGVPPLANLGSLPSVQSDLIEMAPDRVRFRAVRGSGIICAVGVNTVTISLQFNNSGYRPPSASDSVTLFVERDRTTGADDRWITRGISAVNMGAACPAPPWAGNAVQITVPSFAVAADPAAAADLTIGSPARLVETVEYSLYTDATDGRNYLGAESISGGGGRQPVLGPLAANGFNLLYLDVNGNPVACAAPCAGVPNVGFRRQVRTIRVSLAAMSDELVSRTGYDGKVRLTDSVVTLVTLRNAVYR